MMQTVVVFALDEQRFALPLGSVERVLRAVALTPLPQAPEVVRGIIDLQGQIVPVVDIRRRFGLAEREVEPEDQLLIASTPRLRLAMIIDDVIGLVEFSDAEITAAPAIVPGIGASPRSVAKPPSGYLTGVARTDDGLVLIHDLDTLLSLPEERAVEHALAGIA